MKISRIEYGRANAEKSCAEAKILPENRPKGMVSAKSSQSVSLSPLEKGMLVAEAALKDIPDVREDLVSDLKEKIKSGKYEIKGEEVAEMMIRRLRADKIR